jgi:hypothetical protein
LLLATMPLLQTGFVGAWMADYLGMSLLVLAPGACDRATRRRGHPAYALGAASSLARQFVAEWLPVSPWWNVVAPGLRGHEA